MPSVVTSLAAGSPLDHVLPHKLHHEPLFTVKVGGPELNNELFNIYDGVYSFYITNHMLMVVVAAVVVLLLAFSSRKRIEVTGTKVEDYVTKGRLSQTFEVLLTFLREEMVRPALGNLTDKYIGYIWTTFFFILTANLLGMIPLAELLDTFSDGRLRHIGGTATGNLAVTGVLAIVSFFMMLLSGVREQGLRYFAHFAPVPLWPVMKGASAGMLPVSLLLVLLEIVGAFVKPFALCMRLFANMLAGHMVLAALIGLIFLAATGMGTAGGYGVSVPVILFLVMISMLELFVCFLQAYIFTFLTVLFIAQGAVHHDEHAHDKHEFEGPAHGLAQITDAGRHAH